MWDILIPVLRKDHSWHPVMEAGMLPNTLCDIGQLSWHSDPARVSVVLAGAEKARSRKFSTCSPPQLSNYYHHYHHHHLEEPGRLTDTLFILITSAPFLHNVLVCVFLPMSFELPPGWGMNGRPCVFLIGYWDYYIVTGVSHWLSDFPSPHKMLLFLNTTHLNSILIPPALCSYARGLLAFPIQSLRF